MTGFAVFRNVSIAARLGLAGFLAIACILVTTLAGYTGLVQSNAGLNASITSASSLLASTDGDMMHDALRADVLNAMVTGPDGSDAARNAVLQDIDDHAGRFNADLSKLGSLKLGDKVKAQLKVTSPLVSKYIVAARETAKVALTDRTAGQTALPGFLDTFSVLEEQMGLQGKLIEGEGNTESKLAQDSNQGLLKVLLAAAGAAVLVLMVSNILLARSITKPLTRVRDAIKEVVSSSMSGAEMVTHKNQVQEIAGYLEQLRQRLQEALDMEKAILRTQKDQEIVVSALSAGLGRLSAGNLRESITQIFPDQYEALRQNFNATVDRLAQTITKVVQASRSIRSQSDQISAASEDLARRTENQAATLEETAAALDALTTSVKSAANSAREVETIVQSARRETEDSGKVVLGAVDAMNGIERSSEQISQIIGVIDDIAFQTNLLALNAGVEAARAGDAGRGFAVVASEVRALAQRSSDASKEIKTLISTSSQLVGRGVEAVGSAGSALTKMVERVTHISSLVSEISKGAQEQSLGLGEVNVGVTQLDQVAQKNAAMVEESMLATQSLRNEAIGLDGIVSQFATNRPEAAIQRLRAVG